jgi:hypothetical protein
MSVLSMFYHTRHAIKHLHIFSVLFQYSVGYGWAFKKILRVGTDDVLLISEIEQCKPGLTIHK